MQTWKYPSRSGPGEYTVTLADDGLLACNCRGYLIKKNNKPRYCTHTDDIVKKLKLSLTVRGDFQYATGTDETQLDLIPEVDHKAVYASAIERGYINPMKAIAPEKGKSVKDYDPNLFVMEEKYDGERKIVSAKGGQVYTWNRPRESKGEIGKEEPLPGHILEAFQVLAAVSDFVLDGELWLPGAFKSSDVNRIENRPRLCFVGFDALRLADTDLLGQPFMVRRVILEKLINSLEWGGAPPCITISSVFTPSEEELQKIWDRGGEGAILKTKTGLYRPGHRSPDWIKLKKLFQQRFQIVGYKKGKNGPHSTVKLQAEDGSPTEVKTLNNEWLRKLDADPDRYLGKWMVIEHQGRMASGGYRHPMWQYLEEEVG